MYKKKKLILLMMILCSLTMLVGCRKDKPNTAGNQAKIALIATTTMKAESELIFLDQTGSQIESYFLQALGIFSIYQPEPNQLVLPTMYSNQIIYINLEKSTFTTEKTNLYPLYYQKLGKKELIIFNSDELGDIDFLTYQLKSSNSSQQLRIKGFPLCQVATEDQAYIYLNNPDANGKDSIIILDLNPFNINREIPLPVDTIQGAKDMILFDDQLILSYFPHGQLVRLPLDQPDRISVIKLEHPQASKILQYQDQLFVLHSNGVISVLTQEEFKVTLSTRVNYTLLDGDIDFKERKLYILAKDNHQERKVLVLNLDQLHLEQVFSVKSREGLLIQDLIVLDS